MDSNLKYAVTQLERGHYLRLSDAVGRSVAVFKGMAWITQDNDPRDVFVGRGETFRIDRPGVVLVEAVADASLIVLEPQRMGVNHERTPA